MHGCCQGSRKDVLRVEFVLLSATACNVRMGGKRKQAQRTKNNARPSSSGRSAELLRNSAPTFVGFTAVKDGSFIPVLPGFSVSSEEFDPNLNSDFHLVLKKMGKKDSTTKLKALQEFSELITNSELEAVKTVLPLWPRLYCHLAVDVEHRVREAAHQAQRAIVLRVKRNLAPYLHQLAGPWFTSQYDTYAPAASAAALAFQDAFPPNKVTEAIVFCQEDILNYICDNLIVQTAQTMGNPKVVTPEEMEAKYQRIVVSSLQGYALYLQKLPAEHLQAAHEANKKLIASKKFWNLSKHTSALIRNAWFSALIALCQKAPDLLVDEGPHAAVAVFGNLDETDPTVLPTVWEALLHVLTTVQDCWQHVSADKLVLPKLWRILREGGQGNAAAIFPNLLPFLSKLPSSLCSNKQDFYDKFFNNIRHGLSQKLVLQSASECSAVARCYIECLRYTVMLHLSDSDFCQALVQNHLIAAVTLMLKDQKFKLVSSALFPELSVLIYHWSNNEGYTLLVQPFWDSLTSVVLESLSPTGESFQSRPICAEWLLNTHIELCLCLKNPKHKRSRQGLKVTFISPENNSEDESPETESCSETLLSISDDIHTDKYLQTLVEVLSVSYVTKTEQYSDPTFLIYLEKLTSAFESRELFFSLLKVNVTADIQTESNESLVQLYDSTLQKWLQDEKVCAESVVRITFALLKFLTADEKYHILDSLCKVSNTSVLVWCVKSALEHWSDPCVKDWLHSAQLSQILLSLAHEICVNDSDVDAKHILECCFDKIKVGELVLSPAAISDILSEFSRLLSTSHYESICMDVVTELVTSLYSSDLMLCPFLHSNLAAEDLLLSLFRLSCQNDTSRKDKVDAAWHVGICSLARLHGNCSETFLKLTLKFAEVVKEELLTREDALIAPIDRIVATVVSFLRIAAACLPTDAGDLESCLSPVVKLCSVFLDCLSSEFAAREQKVTALCLYAENMKGLLNHTTKHSHAKHLFSANSQNTGKSCTENGEDAVGSEKEIVQYIILLLFSVTLISNIPESLNPVDQEEINDDVKEEYVKQEMSSSGIHLLEDHILTATYSVALCKSFIRHFKSSVYYYKVFFKNDILDERFKMLMNTFGAKEIESITHITARRALQCGSLWVKALHLLHTQMLTQSDLRELYLDLASDAGTDISQTTHIYEIFPSCLKVKDMTLDEATLNEDKLIMLTSWLNQLEGPVPVDCQTPVLSFLNSVFAWYQQNDKTELLFDCSKVRWPQAKKVTAAARFLAAVMEKCPQLLTSDLWDATMISLASWMQTVKNSRNLLLLPPESGILPLLPKTLLPPGSKKKLSTVPDSSHIVKSFYLDSNNEAMFTVAVFQLYKALSDFLTGCYNDLDHPVQISVENMLVEWTDVFADVVHEAVLSIFYTVTGLVRINSVSLLDLPLLESLGDVILKIDPKYFLLSGSTDNNAMIKWCCELLHSPVIPLQLTAYHTLTRLVQGLTDLDKRSGTEHERFGLAVFWDYLHETQTVVQDLLLDISLGNSCTVCPFTDAYTYTTAYLLLWDVVFQMCGLASPELRSHYATLIRELGFLNSLLQNVFRLMPEQVLQTKDPRYKLQKTSEVFSSAPSLVFSQTYSSEMLEHMSCWVYCNALRRLPALVRQWWGDLEPKVATLVEQVTSVHCAPLLCAEEIKVIQAEGMHHGNMLIKVHPSVREVVAVYKVDEAALELSIQLPSNYPLCPVRIENRTQLGDSQLRNQMMQLTFLLTHQNGSIWDGLEHWKSNLDKRFEGVEECYICFSIVHSSNLDIPRKSCSKCKKKFHSACLVKWINTSNKATCPICRNLF